MALYRERRSDTIKTACLGKTRWHTREAAQWTLARIRRENADDDRMDPLVRPYRCGFCKRWHIGRGW